VKLALLSMMPLLLAASEDRDRVRAIPAGTAAKVRTFDGKESKGTLEAVDAFAVRVNHGGQTVSVARSEIGRVSVYDARAARAECLDRRSDRSGGGDSGCFCVVSDVQRRVTGRRGQ